MDSSTTNYATPGLEIQRISKHDRGVFLNPQHYKGDTVLLRCSPKSQRKSHCNWCLKQAELLRCTQCQVYYYCSKECQTTDWRQYHKKECSFIKHLGSRIIPCNILMLIRIHMNNIDLTEFYGGIEGVPTPEQKEQFNETALMIVSHILQIQGKSLDMEQNLDVIGQLMILQGKMQLNAFTLTDTITGVELGIALYEPANFLNHRCSYLQEIENLDSDCANCLITFQGRQLIVFANDLLRAHSKKKDKFELTISYCNNASRQDFLRQHYGFICTCARCIYEQQMHNKERNLRYKLKVKLEMSQLQMINVAQTALQFIKSPTEEEYLHLKSFIDDFQDERFYQPIESVYMGQLSEQKHKEAFRTLKKLISGIPNWLASSQHPYLCLKLNEASKLAFHLNYLTVSEEMAKQAIQGFREFYTNLENFQEYKDLLLRLQEIQCELTMNK